METGQEPKLKVIDGVLVWQFADGTIMPIISGGAPDDGDGDGPPPVIPPGGETPLGDDDEGGDDGEFDKERAMATIRKLRAFEKDAKEAAKLRKEVERLTKAEDDRKKADMTEVERLKAEKGELEGKLSAAQQEAKERLLHSTVTSEAYKANFADPEDAWRMIDHSKVVVGDDGKVTGADEEIKALMTSKPYLLKKQGVGGSVNSQEGRGTSDKPVDEVKRANVLAQRFGSEIPKNLRPQT